MKGEICAICGHELSVRGENESTVIHDCLVMEFNSKNKIVDKRWFYLHKACYKELFIANTKED